jgi:hypothetical protein
VVSVTPRPRFRLEERTPVTTVQEAGWTPEPVWTQRLEEKSFAFAGDRTSIARLSSPYPGTILIELTGYFIKMCVRLFILDYLLYYQLFSYIFILYTIYIV